MRLHPEIETCCQYHCQPCVEKRAAYWGLKPETIRTIWALRPAREYGKRLIRTMRVML